MVRKFNRLAWGLIAGTFLLALGLITGTFLLGADKQETSQAAKFLEDMAVKAGAAEKEEKTVVRGKEGWLFLTNELRSLGAGEFWGEAAQKASRASNPEARDPLPAILDFKAQLDKAGIEFLFVPVPAKAAIYPEMISDAVSVPKGAKAPRLDIHHEKFLKMLKEQGVKVVDLAPLFLEHRFDAEGYMYCQQDTHWSGRACVLTAKQIMQEIKGRPWLKDVPVKKYESEERKVEITADLWSALGDASLSKENLPLTFVGERSGDSLAALEPSRESPVLLVGDSHNLVFHTGEDMHAKGAGLADQLALELGFPVDLVGVRGSGATPSRVNLMRRKDNLKGKKLIIWCLTVREFTEGSGWQKIPVIRPEKP